MERIWKEFGKNTLAGKLLFDLYGTKFKPEEHIKYPKLSIKTTPNENKTTENKPLTYRNKTQQKLSKIDYPKNEIERPKIPKIEFISKRKNQKEIQKDLDKIKKESAPQKNPILKNRKLEIEKLQDKFQYEERKILPLKARPPVIKFDDETNLNENLIEKKTESKYEKLKNQIYEGLNYDYQRLNEINLVKPSFDNKGKRNTIEKLSVVREIQSKINDLKVINEKLYEENKIQ